MMTLLARGLSWLVGSNLIAPISLIAALTFAHQAWLARETRVEARGEARCEAEHQLATMRVQRDTAVQAAEQARTNFRQQHELSETMRNEREAIRAEFAAYKATASADPRCLSDGVLDLLRGYGPAGGHR